MSCNYKIKTSVYMKVNNWNLRMSKDSIYAACTCKRQYI